MSKKVTLEDLGVKKEGAAQTIAALRRQVDQYRRVKVTVADQSGEIFSLETGTGDWSSPLFAPSGMARVYVSRPGQDHG